MAPSNLIPLGLNYNANSRSMSRSRGTSILFGRDGEDHENVGEKIGRSRLLPFGKHLRMRGGQGEEVEHEDGVGEHSEDDENSSDDESSLHQLRGFRARFKAANFRNHHKNLDKQPNLVQVDTSQVRFLTSTQQQHSREYHARRVEKIGMLGAQNMNTASIRYLPNGEAVVDKKPVQNHGKQKSHPIRLLPGKMAEDLAEKKRQATTNYCLIMEILVK